MALRYLPVTEAVTPPISPARAHAVDTQKDSDRLPMAEQVGCGTPCL